VIRDQLESVRRDPDAWRYLSLLCLGRPKNFADHLEGRHLGGTKRRGDITRGSVLPDDTHEFGQGEVEW
jgi:hypothetical protein